MIVSERKRATAIANAKLATVASMAIFAQRIASVPPWKCVHCGVEKTPTVHQRRKTYCSKRCMAAGYRTRLRGAANPHYKNIKRVCIGCGIEFLNYNKKRKFCNRDCYWDNIEVSDNIMPKHSPRKDNNHREIIELLEKHGFSVIDISGLGRGAPDILICKNNIINLVEIKNPKTSYGKMNGSKRQVSFANKWMGAPIYIMRTEKDVNNFARGRYGELSRVG